MKHPSRLAAVVRAAVLAAATTLCATPALLAADDDEPVAVAASFDAVAQAGALLKVSQPQLLKGMTRVAVPQFSVQFVTADSASAETSGFAAAGRARVTANYKLQGVTEPDFQAMTEALYVDFLKDLQASGLEVLPFAQVVAAPSYPRLAASGVATPVRDDSSIIVAPVGMALYGSNRAVATMPAKKAGLFDTLSGMGSVVSAIGSIGDVQSLSKELGDAALLEVHMIVNFVELKDNNRGFFGRMASTASVSAKTAPSIGQATLGVQVGAVRGVVSLARVLALDASAFTEVREQAKSTGEKVGGAAVAVLAFAIGSSTSSSHSALEAVADPARYREVVSGGLGQVGKLFAARLKSER